MDRQVKNGIWKFADFFPPVPSSFRLSLNEGNTPLKFVEGIYYKCEYLNPTGSMKDRGLAYQVSKIYESGFKRAVISSSGNAAIAAANYCQMAKIALTVFVSPHIDRHKLKTLENLSCQIVKTPKAISQAIRYVKDNHAYYLRQSTDQYATFGYLSVAFELLEQEPRIDAIFIPLSSGTGLVGIATGYQQKNKKLPAFHAVQTEAVHPIASLFDHDYQQASKSIADAIVAKYTPREKEIVKIIQKSKGFGWVVSDDHIKQAADFLTKHNLKCSYEGASSLAAYWKATQNGYQYKFPVCLLTGKFYS